MAKTSFEGGWCTDGLLITPDGTWRCTACGEHVSTNDQTTKGGWFDYDNNGQLGFIHSDCYYSDCYYNPKGTITMKKYNILCSIDGWITTKNQDKVQVTIEPNNVLEHASSYEEPPYQLDCFCVAVTAHNAALADKMVHDKLYYPDKELIQNFGDFDIHSFSSHCVESNEAAIDIGSLSLSTIIQHSKLLQLIQNEMNNTEHAG